MRSTCPCEERRYGFHCLKCEPIPKDIESVPPSVEPPQGGDGSD